MKPRIIACHYIPNRPDYNVDLMTNTYRKSVERFGYEFEQIECGPFTNLTEVMTHRLDTWASILKNSDRPCIFTDLDFMMCKDPAFIFDEEFDVGVTVRNGRPPINGGALYAHPTEGADIFMSEWIKNNRYFVDNNKLFRRSWYRRVWTQDQAGLLQTLNNPPKCNIKRLPCLIWNCADAEWGKFNEETVMLHLKGELRDKVNGKSKIGDKKVDRIAKIYLGFRSNSNT